MIGDIENFFMEITGLQPYKYQIHCIEEILNGNPMIIRAPTGSGKTEISVLSFLLGREESLPSQMIYSLPTQILVENIGERIKNYVKNSGLESAIYHGSNIEGNVFKEDAVISTIDQTISSYCSLPLSIPKRFGNICAGAVSTSFLVFDEAHIYDPYRGLQSVLSIVNHSSKIGFPWVIMSATLPDVFIIKIKEYIECKYGCEVSTFPQIKNGKVKKITDDMFPSRKGRKIKLYLNLDENITIDNIIEIINTHGTGKYLVVVNTVKKSQELFLQLKRKKPSWKIILIHSRFKDADKKEKEQEVVNFLGKNSEDFTIVISTQVVEAGMDISADVLITEVSPIDSLLQRIGRVARWSDKKRKEGVCYIFDCDKEQPYSKRIITKSRMELSKYDGKFLKWEDEVDMVNNVYNDEWDKILDPSLMYKVLGKLANAIYSNNKVEIEENVRNILTCEVSIYSDPALLEDKNIFISLPRVRVNFNVFRNESKNIGLENIYVVEENPIIDEYESKYCLSPISDEEDIVPFKHYIIKSGKYISYSSNAGLLFNDLGEEKFFESIKAECDNMQIHEDFRKYVKETWVDHAVMCAKVFENEFLPKHRYTIRKFAKYFGVSEGEMIDIMKLAITLHDIGKLDREWQKRIGCDDCTEPLAHNDVNKKIGRPHATIGYPSLLNFFYTLIGRRYLVYSLLLSISNHHTSYTTESVEYAFIDDWKKYIRDVIFRIDLKYLKFDIDDIINKIKSEYSKKYPYEKLIFDISTEKEVVYYRFYTFLSKILRQVDWRAVEKVCKYTI